MLADRYEPMLSDNMTSHPRRLGLIHVWPADVHVVAFWHQAGGAVTRNALGN